MERKIIDIMFSLLRFELGSGAALTEDERALAAAELDSLLKLSKAHDAEHLVCE